jgi:predicted DNA binding protein
MSTFTEWSDSFLRESVFRSSIGILCCEPNGQIAFSNERIRSRLGYSQEQLRGKQITTLCAGDAAWDRLRSLDESVSRTSVTLQNSNGDQDTVVVSVDSVGESGEYYVLWIQQQLECTDSAWRESTQSADVFAEINTDLVNSQGSKAIAERVLSAAKRFTGSSVGCFRLFEDSTGDLIRVATTERAEEWIAARPTFDLDASLAARAFRREQTILDTDSVVVPDADGRSSERLTGVHVPVGSRGTLTIYAPNLPDETVETLEQLATVTQAHLDRSEQHNDSTGTAEWLAELTADLGTVLEQTGTEAAVMERACQRLVAVGEYSGAWYVDAATKEVVAAAGPKDSLPVVVQEAVAADRSSEAVEAALQTDAVRVVHDRQTVTQAGESDNRETKQYRQTKAVVPVSYSDQKYGVMVLTVATNRPEPPSKDGLSVLKGILGLAVYAANTRQLLLSENMLELEFEVTSLSCLAVGISATADCYCEVEHSTVSSDGQHLLFVRAEGASPSAVQRAAEQLETVERTSMINEATESCLIEVRKSSSGADAMMDIGATVTSASADDGVGRLVVAAPISADVHEIVDAYTTANPDSRLTAKREVDGRDKTGDRLGKRLRSALTERQYSVLTTAYYAGYYDWPRQRTAEQVADSLGITSATLHQHLRRAEQKLIELSVTE